MNVFGYDLKVGSRHACPINVIFAYNEPQMGQEVIILTHHAIEMKGLNHQLMHPMQCCMNGVWINEVPKFLAPNHSETMHVIQVTIPFNATNSIIIPWPLTRVTRYFDVLWCEKTNSKSMRIRITSKKNSWQELHHQSHQVLGSVGKNIVCLTTGDGLATP